VIAVIYRILLKQTTAEQSFYMLFWSKHRWNKKHC